MFFVFHYGFFHFAYLKFIYTSAEVNLNDGYEIIYDKINADLGWIAVAVFIFAIGHLISLYKNIAADLKTQPNLGAIMFLPYGRIVPMHLTILLGAFLASDGAVMILFLLIKAAADLLTHGFEHAWLQKIT